MRDVLHSSFGIRGYSGLFFVISAFFAVSFVSVHHAAMAGIESGAMSLVPGGIFRSEGRGFLFGNQFVAAAGKSHRRTGVFENEVGAHGLRAFRINGSVDLEPRVQ